MDIKQYVDKNVLIVAGNGKTFYGTVDEFLFGDENGLDEDSIVLKTKNNKLIEFVADDIIQIEVLE